MIPNNFCENILHRGFIQSNNQEYFKWECKAQNDMKNTYLSLIIPAYNEEERISTSIEKAIEYLSKQTYSWHIFVVDDGSKDRTIEVLKPYSDVVTVLAQPRNMGKGAAVRRGMCDTDGQVRVFTDADFSTPIYELEKLLERINTGADICIGSRALDRSLVKEHQPFYREWMGRVFNYIVQLLVFRGITDTQCGFKGFTAQAANAIFPLAKIDGFSFDVEILYLANKAKLNISQVPVEWYNDGRSKVNPIFDSINMFLELFRIKRLHK